MPRSETMQRDYLAPDSLPVRKRSRPKTIVGPLHIQCNRHGDSKHLNKLVKDVLTWPYIESIPAFVNRDIVRVRLEEKAASSDSAAFISDREFARFLLAAPTIYLVLASAIGAAGYRAPVGRAPLSSIFRIGARRHRGCVYARESGGTRGLLFPFLRGLSFCLQVRPEERRVGVWAYRRKGSTC
jgi:hypothetical protein